MDIYNNIVISVFAGVITSALIFIFVQVFQKIFMPWFRQATYKGVDVSGAWYWENHFGSTVKMELKQAAGYISGVYTYVPSNNRGNIKIYYLTGKLKDRFLQLSMESADPKRLGVLSYVFEIVGDANQIKGYSVFYATNTHEICAVKESFYRSYEAAKSEAEATKISVAENTALTAMEDNKSSQADVSKADASA